MRNSGIYPFKCAPILKQAVWGGNWLNFKSSAENTPQNKIGESWELADRINDSTLIANGHFSGRKLFEILKQNKNKYLGVNFRFDRFGRFPLLIKYIDAADRLSVQTHPDNNYVCCKKCGDTGKTEFWYVVAAEKKARIIFGLKKGVSRADFELLVKNEQVEKALNFVSVKSGDSFYIPAGVVHALLEGVRIAEIQQNSDITYRIYDWKRFGLDGRPRQLNLTEALETVNFKYSSTKNKSAKNWIVRKKYSYKKLLKSDFFKIEEYLISEYSKRRNCCKFDVFMIIEGSGFLTSENEQYAINAGDTWFIPAALESIKISAAEKIKMLKINV